MLQSGVTIEEIVQTILEALFNRNKETVLVGRTKVFLRPSTVRELEEKLRSL